MSVGTVTRWVPRHGLPRLLLARAARAGDLRAQMMKDPAVCAEPFAMYEQLRRRGRLVPGSFMNSTVDYEVADAVLRSDAFGSPVVPERLPPPLRWVGRLFPDELAVGPVDPPSMLVVDPPQHTRYRRLVAKVFTARAVEALRARTDVLSRELLDGLAPRADAAPNGVVDLVEAFAAPLPVTVIAEVLGVPVDRREDLLAWGAAATPSLDVGLSYREFAAVERGVRAFNGFMSGHLDRITRRPGDDILSRLVALHEEGERLDRAELLSIAGLLLAAGFETTVNLIANGAVLLLRHRDQLDALRAEPTAWPNAVEEILRFDSPVQSTARRALRGTVVAGHAVTEGAVIAILLGGVNRDPQVFPDPARFDVRRSNAREHLAFSAGIHFCLGAALARMEAEIALRGLFGRFPGLALAGAPERGATRTLHGFARIPVVLG
jgi:cytochrome P450